jgi:exonuclease VII large subunit
MEGMKPSAELERRYAVIFGEKTSFVNQPARWSKKADIKFNKMDGVLEQWVSRMDFNPSQNRLF